MSQAFSAFIKQLNAKGMERGDGFYPNHFTGMNEQEKDLACEILTKTANTGDITAIEGLGLLSTKNSISELLRIFADKNQSDNVRLSTASSIWKATNDSAFQKYITEFLSSPEPRVRMRAANELRFTNPTKALYDTYKNLLLRESDRKTRQAAALGFMQCIGLLEGPFDIGTNHIDLFQKLSSTNSKTCTLAISEAEKDSGKVNSRKI